MNIEYIVRRVIMSSSTTLISEEDSSSNAVKSVTLLIIALLLSKLTSMKTFAISLRLKSDGVKKIISIFSYG